MIGFKILWYEILEGFSKILSTFSSKPDEIPDYLKPKDPCGILDCTISKYYAYSTDKFCRVVTLDYKEKEINTYQNYRQIFGKHPDLKPILLTVYNTELYSRVSKQYPKSIVLLHFNNSDFIDRITVISLEKFVQLFVFEGKEYFTQRFGEIESVTLLGPSRQESILLGTVTFLDDTQPYQFKLYKNFQAILQNEDIKDYPAEFLVVNEIMKNNIVLNANPDHHKIYGVFFRKPIIEYVQIKHLF